MSCTRTAVVVDDKNRESKRSDDDDDDDDDDEVKHVKIEHYDRETFERRCIPDRLKRYWKEREEEEEEANWIERIRRKEGVPEFLTKIKRCKTYTGQATRYHLSRGASEARTNKRRRLQDEELDFAVQLFEHAEEILSEGKDFEIPFHIFLFLIETYPGWTAVYWKAALCLSVLGDVKKNESLILSLLRWAVKLEPDNEVLHRNVDGFIRILSYPQSLDAESFWSMSKAPKSMGDLQVLMVLLLRSESLKEMHSKELRKLIREKRLKRFKVV